MLFKVDGVNKICLSLSFAVAGLNLSIRLFSSLIKVSLLSWVINGFKVFWEEVNFLSFSSVFKSTFMIDDLWFWIESPWLSSLIFPILESPIYFESEFLFCSLLKEPLILNNLVFKIELRILNFGFKSVWLKNSPIDITFFIINFFNVS